MKVKWYHIALDKLGNTDMIFPKDFVLSPIPHSTLDLIEQIDGFSHGYYCNDTERQKLNAWAFFRRNEICFDHWFIFSYDKAKALDCSFFEDFLEKQFQEAKRKNLIISQSRCP